MTAAEEDTGYYGVWYGNDTMPAPYNWKYAGGLGTYPTQQGPQAIYVASQDKTFFTYGGRAADGDLRINLGFFDHATGLFAKPRIWHELEGSNDAHENASIAIDDDGYIYLYINGHGSERQARIRRSESPYSITSYTDLLTGDDGSVFGSPRSFSYAWAWFLNDQHNLFHIRYNGSVREMMFVASSDGDTWPSRTLVSSVESGHYQVVKPYGNDFGIAFDLHPTSGGIDARTNLHFMWRTSAGTFETADGSTVSVPLEDRTDLEQVLVHDYEDEDKLVYIKDIAYDASGHPIIVYVTTDGHEPGPGNNQTVKTARWTGSEWVRREVVVTTHNYDHGELRVNDDGSWTLIGTFYVGAQSYGAGGDIGEWTSTDQGQTWTGRNLTNVPRSMNFSHPRLVVNGNDDFVALWASGHAYQDSSSNLYFMNRAGKVWRMPETMSGSTAPGIETLKSGTRLGARR